MVSNVHLIDINVYRKWEFVEQFLYLKKKIK